MGPDLYKFTEEVLNGKPLLFLFSFFFFSAVTRHINLHKLSIFNLN